ncbi:uncharacterized protein LOC111292580 isoform X3 [Durio zibethinus]|uniref:Uncharacterized protein LOC111292580 isoform X3 n=1 Tax=Durio zibethinus TaxID=66656 RepID=A0A6P5YKE8_DURZI|nr:uncharacterized protein LOC111292580 isoform X3 [Durio zibethinus]
MVCSIGSGRMAVMARLLEAGSISPNVAEEVGNKKLAAQYIYRELRGADEANLLDEEDMHVFGLKPMADPLNLVCCNACKKPVKASQYAAHAELCRSLKTTEDTILELDVSTGHRKPPRKERKKSLAAYANQPTPVGEQERSEVIDADDPIASESHMDGQIRMTSSLTIDAKRNSSCVDTTYVMDGSGANLQNADHSTSVVPPSTKRFKLIVGCLPLPDDPNTASGVTEILDTHGLYSSRDSPVETVSDTETANDRQVHEHCLLTKDIPIPLSSKIYYSQRSSRLRTALSHQYFVTSAKELCSDFISRQESQQNTILSQASSQGDCPLEQVDNLLIKKQDASMQKPDQVLGQCSEVCLSMPGCPPSNDFSSQHLIDDIPKPLAASVGLMRSKYISKPYSFTGNSGKLLGPMQPPNGSVPVV